MADKITRFIGEHAFLSNWHIASFSVNGKLYPSVEHAYQASKASTESEHEIIRHAKTPAEAKKLGQSIVVREGWHESKVSLMRDFVRAKFDNPLLQELLVATGDAELVQDNKFNDRFWGTCGGVGQNWLGKILQEVREEVIKKRGEDMIHWSSNV